MQDEDLRQQGPGVRGVQRSLSASVVVLRPPYAVVTGT